MMRQRYEGAVVCEPRHPTWFDARAHVLMNRYAIARVAADPAITERSHAPGGWDGLAYFRLHGAPHMYWSRYGADYLSPLATRVRRTSSGATGCRALGVFESVQGARSGRVDALVPVVPADPIARRAAVADPLFDGPRSARTFG